MKSSQNANLAILHRSLLRTIDILPFKNIILHKNAQLWWNHISFDT